MSGRIVRGADLRGEHALDADVVVCGGGAGGCMAARELARGGRRVLVLEEGDDLAPGDLDQREDTMMPRLFQQAGGRRTADGAIVVLGGRGLGGSTLHNQNLCKRTPDEVLRHWGGALGVEGVEPQTLAPLFEEVERDLGVAPIHEEQVNAHNRIVRRGVAALGWRGGMLSHNRDARCIGSGFCELGCAYDGKLHARRVLVPQALAAGAVFYTGCEVRDVLHDGARVRGVRARLGDTGVVEVTAPVVCLAGSAIGSAALARKSRVPDPHAQLGRGLRLHPAAMVAGVFDEPVRAWRGIPQSWECTEHLDFTPGSDRRVWLVPSFSHPVGAASLMPGFGPEHARRMRSYDRLAVLAAMVHDETEGRVAREGGRTVVRYEPVASDREQLALGVRAGARILLAAGARECVCPAVPPIVIRSESDLERVTADRFRPHDAELVAVHPMGTLRMGPDPRTSATDSRGAHHHLRGLWVTDGSLFPTSIGVPPQLSVYTFAMRAARLLAG